MPLPTGARQTIDTTLLEASGYHCPEVEQAMAARLTSFLKEHRMEGDGAKLLLRYGQ